MENKYVNVPFNEWLPIDKGGEIPWHKVYYFKYTDKIVWDRSERQYNPEIFELNNNYSNINIISPVNIVEENTRLPEVFSVLTWNIMFDNWKKLKELKKEQVKFEPRLDNLVSHIKNCNPDIICFQEITHSMYQLIINVELFKTYYITSIIEFSEFYNKGYGQIILTKYKPISQNLLKYSEDSTKTFLHLKFEDFNGNIIDMYNIHLTSNIQKNAQIKRVKQLEYIISSLEPQNNYIILGDFNMRENVLYQIKDRNIIPKVQEVLHENFTFDPEINPLAIKLLQNRTPANLDKILYGGINVTSAKLVGNEGPIVSDHFGILVNFSSAPIKTSLEFPIDNNTTLSIILDIKYWNFVNKYRKNCTVWPPHVTVYQSFITVKDYFDHKIKSKIPPIDPSPIIFDVPKIFDRGSSYLVVLVSSQDEHLRQLKQSMNILLGGKQTDYNPHITLCSYKTKKEAEELISQLQTINIVVDPSQLCLMEKKI